MPHSSLILLAVASVIIPAPSLAYIGGAAFGLPCWLQSRFGIAHNILQRRVLGGKIRSTTATSLQAVLSQPQTTEFATVGHGDKVRIAFSGKNDEGIVVVKSAAGAADALFKAKQHGHQPLKEVINCIGGNEIAQPVEKALMGLREGDTTEVRLCPAEAYGERDEDLVYTITKDMVGTPDDMPIPVGTSFKLKGGIQARVTEEDGKWLVLDANHELSGSHITFNIMVQEITKAGCGAPMCEIEEMDFLEDA